MSNKLILFNVIYLFTGNVVTKFLGAVSTIIYIRYSGATDYAILAIALAFSTIVVFFTDAGIGQTTMREGSKKEANLSIIMHSYIKARLLLLGTVILFSILFLTIIYHSEPEKLYAILALTIPTLFGALLQSVGIIYFQMIEKTRKVLQINIVVSAAMAIALFLGIYCHLNIVLVCFIYGLANVLGGIYAFILVTKAIKLEKKMDYKIFNQLLVFTINGMITISIPQIGPLLLDHVLSIKELGYYAAAFKIPSVLYQFPGVIATAFYPRLFQLGNAKEIEQHRYLSSWELKSMTILGAIIALPFVVNAKYWIITLLSANMAQAASAFVVLSYLILLQSIKYPLADFLTTIGKQRARTLIMTISFIFSIVAYLLLGKEFGLTGAAFAPLFAETIIILGCITLIPNGWRFFFTNTSWIIASFIFCVVIYHIFLDHLYPLVSILIIEIGFMSLVVGLQKSIRVQVRTFMEVRFRK